MLYLLAFWMDCFSWGWMEKVVLNWRIGGHISYFKTFDSYFYIIIKE